MRSCTPIRTKIRPGRRPVWPRLQTFLAVLGVIGLGACASESAAPDEPELRIVFVTHGQASDPFWSVVQNGASDAARDVGARVEYQAPESFDMVTMAQLIDAAVASMPDGLVVSLPDAEALRAPLAAAREAGIPFISINSGSDESSGLGSLLHVGQTEFEAGFGGGERMAGEGVRKALCVNQEVGNLSLDRRCEGFGAALRNAGAEMEILAVELTDPTESQQRMEAALRSDSLVDGLLTLGPTGAVPALRALRETGRTGAVRFATFDASPEVLQAIEDGEALFAIDQQQYMQGYLPVVLLALYRRNENLLAHEVIRTGPGFITADNVARLRELTRQGTR